MLQEVGRGVTQLLNHPEHMLRAIGGVVAVAVGVFTAREGAKLARKQLAAVLGRPSLVRATSRMSLTRPLHAMRVLRQRLMQSNMHEAFKSVVLEPQLQQRVLGLAEATRNTKLNEAPFRHMCFYGPPGTGKVLLQPST